MLIKILLVLLLLFVLGNLFHALWLMLRGENQQSMTRALGRRLLFSVLIFAGVLLLMFFGIIQPNTRPY